MSEEGLDTTLKMAARGDQAAWRTIVEAYGPRVFGLLRAQCGDADLAEEIAQSTFCTVAAKLGGDEAEGGYVEQGRFESWLFCIAMNRLRDEMRRRRRHASTGRGGGALSADADEARWDWSPGGPPRRGSGGAAAVGSDAAEVYTTPGPERDEQIAALRQAIARMSPADRQILELRHLAGLSFKQIAEILEEPLGTVLARQHRALAKLRDLIQRRLELRE